MSRPEITVVMPFGGQPEEPPPALQALRDLDARPGDELILVDNVGVASDASAQVTIVPAPGERSPAHARNVGAERACTEWILFLDADTSPLPGLLEAYFSEPIADDVGAIAGELVPALSGSSVTARYGAARNFLSQQAHIRHPYLPRAAAANLLVRRAALEQVGGFYEGVRAAEDTDFSWRLQRAGWRLELRSAARAEHRYRGSLGDLRRQWRSYAAGRAWLARRYEGFTPEPAAARGVGRVARRIGRGRRRKFADTPDGVGVAPGSAGERGPFLALDVLLALEELAGLALSNRPADREPSAEAQVDLVLVADRFPGRGDPLVELAARLEGARVEAVSRPEVPDLDAVRRLSISYLEDEGVVERILAGLVLVARHPILAGRDFAARAPGDPSLWALAPAVQRLERQPEARVHALHGTQARGTARRLAALTARPMVD